jgi:hypothetical protein
MQTSGIMGGTVDKALAMLRGEGLAEISPGMGGLRHRTGGTVTTRG